MKKSIGAKTIVFPAPAFVVGTYDKEGKANVMTAAWGGICCSQPPCVTVSLREATYTYGNIMERKAFTLNIPSSDYVKEVDYFGLVSGRDTDKFAVTGLTPVKSDLVDAPCVKEFPYILECELLHTFKIGLHTQFIGKVLDIKAEEDILGEKNRAIIEKLKPFLYVPDSRDYYGFGESLGKGFSTGKDFVNK